MTIADVFTGLGAIMLVFMAAIHSMLGSVLGALRLFGAALHVRADGLAHGLGAALMRPVWNFHPVALIGMAGGLMTAVIATRNVSSAGIARTAIGIGGAGIYDAMLQQPVGWPAVAGWHLRARVAGAC
ncbi:MAG: hypothetical protein R3D67_05600 [Hyphomicrobiaceae bacterium]